MDYKEKYEQALERAKVLYSKGAPDSLHLEQMFPELKESEDEKIRKTIKKALKGECCLSADETNKCLDWLEKQKPITDEEYEQGKKDVLWCIKQAKKNAKDENEMGTCWFAEKWLEKQGEKKSAWSEEDEEFLRRAINATRDAYPITADWLKQLKERIGG